MWVIASLPLWIAGGICIASGVHGLWVIGGRPHDPRDHRDFWGSMFLIVAAAVLLPLAAKVAS